MPLSATSDTVSTARAQQLWAAVPLGQRLAVLRKARHLIAARSALFPPAISPELSRTPADTLAAEVLPLLAACRFLERKAQRILKPRHLGRRGLPFWLAGVHSSVERVPFGTVLIIAPSNYPLLLAGVQALQALAAGNAVVWKPGRGGCAVARLLAAILAEAGLPDDLLRVTDDSVAAGIMEVQARPDKIVFTGSAEAGKDILHLAADSATPVVAELSGCDAVFVLPSADPALVEQALLFGMRLNGSATCMAPRRLILAGQGHEALIAALKQSFAQLPGVELTAATQRQLNSLLAEAEALGAVIQGSAQRTPVLITGASPAMQITSADFFAPVLSVLRAASLDEAVRLHAASRTGLTAAIFGRESEALALGQRLSVGTVLINDLIVPTADPRVPFGGRGASGFGATRGAEGLLEMTAARVVSVRRRNDARHFAETGEAHEALFGSAISMSHGATVSERFRGLRGLIAAARRLGSNQIRKEKS